MIAQALKIVYNIRKKGLIKDEELIYLDTYVLQKDMRIRMPKSIFGEFKLRKREKQIQSLL